MQYKLINKTTKEEHICSKVTIADLDYYVNDILTPDKVCIRYIDGEPHFMIYDKGITHKQLHIVASNNQNFDKNIIDNFDSVVEQAFNIKNPSVDTMWKKAMWKDGYINSQETHPFSNENMILFSEWCAKSNFTYYFDGDKWTWGNSKTQQYYSSEEMLGVFLNEQVKIIYYN